MFSPPIYVCQLKPDYPLFSLRDKWHMRIINITAGSTKPLSVVS